mmetsp:Transcript_28635/g.35145  ORF Transcript_28635/g.35145 Transcript_28635/m.35145 type:complete len:942 (+) Transcript_28635:185-3010(+)
MSVVEDFSEDSPPPPRTSAGSSFAGSIVVPERLGLEKSEPGESEEPTNILYNARSGTENGDAAHACCTSIDERLQIWIDSSSQNAASAHSEGKTGSWIGYKSLYFVLWTLQVLSLCLRFSYVKSKPVFEDRVDDIRARFFLTNRQPSRRELFRAGSYESWVFDMERRGRKWSVCAFLTALILTTVFMFTFLALYTGLLRYFEFNGYIILLLKELDSYYRNAMIGMGSACGILLLYFIFDLQYNKGCLLRLFGYIIVLVSSLTIIVTSVYFLEIQPIVSIGVLTLMAPLTLFWTKSQCFPYAETIVFQIGVLIPLIVCGIFSLSIYIIHVMFNKTADFWEFSGSEFNKIVECEYEDLQAYEREDRFSAFLAGELDMPCVNAYMEFVAPFYLFCYCFFISSLLIFVIRVERQRRRTRAIVDIEPMAFWFFFIMTAFLVSMWITSTMLQSETDVNLSSTVVVFSVVVITTFIIYAVSILGSKYLISQAKKSPVGSKLVVFLQSDWVHALIVFFLIVPLGVYFAISFVTQCIRKYTCLGKHIETEEERKRWMTKEAWRVYAEMCSWEWGTVLTKCLWVGIIFFTIIIGIGRVVALFLSFIGEELAKFPLPVTTTVFVIIGLVMFALPPVPGLPVYLAGGIVLTRNAIEQLNWSFHNAAMYAALVNYILKLIAIALQQKVIGDWIGSKSVYIRSLCGVNSLELRAMRQILEKKGFSIPKIMILVGGPDWPTSVLTGIMKLSVTQMLIGSLPHILLVVPASLSGSLLIPQAPGGVSQGLRPVLLTLTFLIQAAAIMVAFHYTAKYSNDHRAELQSMEPDKAVADYDADKALDHQASKEVTTWRRLPRAVRIGHLVAVGMMITSNLAFMLLGDFCFVPFSVEDSIDVKLNGKVGNIVKVPLGDIMLSVFFAACFYVFVFTRYRKRRISKFLQRASFVGERESRLFDNL